MPQVQLRRFEQILARGIGRLVARTDLSDVSDAAVAKLLVAVDARELDEGYFQLTRLRDLFDLRTAVGEDLTERAQEISPNTLQRLAQSFASGFVTFSRAGTTGTVAVATGTVVKTAEGTQFRTTQQGQVTNGSSSSAPVPITAVVPGVAGNVSSGTISRFGSKPPGIDSVTNSAGTANGRDQESEDAFRQRARNYISSLSRSPVQALEFATVGIQDEVTGRSVVFSRVFEDPVDRGNVILYVDDGQGTAAENGTPVTGESVVSAAVGGEEFASLASAPVNEGATFTVTSSTRGSLELGATYYFNSANGRLFFTPALAPGEVVTASYTPYANLIPTVQRVVDGDRTDRQNFPGYRAAGVLVRVLSPNVVPIAVEGLLSVKDEDRNVAVANAQRAVYEYVNGIGIGRATVVRNEIIDRIMDVSGVTDVALSEPAANIIILDDEIPRITATTLVNLT